jgi:hypothetical protein
MTLKPNQRYYSFFVCTAYCALLSIPVWLLSAFAEIARSESAARPDAGKSKHDTKTARAQDSPSARTAFDVKKASSGPGIFELSATISTAANNPKSP